MAGSGGMISLNFDDADVYSVIQTIFGEVLRVNYIIDPRVKGRVTFRSVAPVARDHVLPVMEVILRLNGVGVVEDSDLYRIVPLSDVSREPSPVSFGRDPAKIPVSGKSIIQVVPITYLQSTEVIKLITPFLSASAVVLDVPKSNQLIIVDTDASVRRILQLVDTFDNETQKKKRAQAYVYPVQNGKASDIANLLQQIFLGATGARSTASTATTLTTAKSGSSTSAGQTATPPPPASSILQNYGGKTGTGDSLVSEMTKIFADEIRNTIIILATPEDYDLIKETISKIDTTPRQVMIEGVIAEINLKDNMSLGLAYAIQGKFGLGSGRNLTGDIGLNADTLNPTTTTTTSGSTTTTVTALDASTSGFSYIAKDSSGDFKVYVNALASDTKGKVLAAPHILVSDNREARIQVGQQVPIATSTTNYPTSGDTTSTQTYQYKDIGIILKIKPQINDGGLVSLELAQEISSYTIDKSLTTSTQTPIIVNKTEAQTNVVVQDGQTIAIGGLIREDNSSIKSGVPFLNKIPVLGLLFGNTSKEVIRRELIILLTPHVVKNQVDAHDVTSKFVGNITSADTSKGGLKKEELIKGGVDSEEKPNGKKPSNKKVPNTTPQSQKQPVLPTPTPTGVPQNTPPPSSADIFITPDNQVLTNTPAVSQPQQRPAEQQPATTTNPQSQPAPSTTAPAPAPEERSLQPKNESKALPQGVHPDFVITPENQVMISALVMPQKKKEPGSDVSKTMSQGKNIPKQPAPQSQPRSISPAGRPDLIITPENQPRHG